MNNMPTIVKVMYIIMLLVFIFSVFGTIVVGFIGVFDLVFRTLKVTTYTTAFSFERSVIANAILISGLIFYRKFMKGLWSAFNATSES